MTDYFLTENTLECHSHIMLDLSLNIYLETKYIIDATIYRDGSIVCLYTK